MKGLGRHPLRVIGRFCWLAGEVTLALVDFARHCVFRPKKSSLAARARWLQRASRRHLRLFELAPETTGPIPSRGLLVCNHLSYLDILVLSSITPAVFVAKREIKSWPLFGRLADWAGTLFIDRERRTHVRQMNAAIQSVLDQGLLVVLFPEGTSSNGQTVLPFKSSLLEPAAQTTHPLAIGSIQYQLEAGDVGEDVCYWGDMVFFPHLINLTSHRAIRASVRFAPMERTGADRKELARQLHAGIRQLNA
jgi:1-acyl-sn-glycerol-3-phosphate acyltransferase